MRPLPRLLPLIAVAIGGVIAVRAIGAAPGLFEGSQAVAREGEAAAAAPATTSAAPVCTMTEAQLAEAAGISPAELRVLQSLSTRRTELDARDQDFATLLPLMAAAEQKLDERIAELQRTKGEVEGLLGQLDEQEKAELDRLVAVYSAMRPREAAAVFATLDDRVRLPVAAAMRPRALAAVMAQMTPAAARELTEKLARRYEGAREAARAAVAAADGAATGQTTGQATPAQTQQAENRAPSPQPAASDAARRSNAQNTAGQSPAPQRRPSQASRTPTTRAPSPQPASQPSAPPAGSAAEGASEASPPARQPRQTVQ